MTPPIRPEPAETDPLAELLALKAARGAADPLTELQATSTAAKTAKRQEEFKSGRMARRFARESANEREALDVAPSYAQQALGGISALTKDIPGVEALSAAASSGLSKITPAEDQSYAEALSDIRSGYEAAPKAVRIPNRIIGGTIATAALPITSPAKAGAAYGGLLNLLSADPDQTAGERAFKTAAGAAVGGAVGKGLDAAGTFLRAKFAEPLGIALERLKALRSERAAPLYAEALEQGVGQTGTPEIQAFLARPEVQKIVEELSGLDKFRGLAPDDPVMLDAVYKVLSDEAGTIVKRMAANAPNRPNIGREAMAQIRGVQEQGLEAMSGGLNAPMPAYRPAVQAFAEGSRAVEALKRGSAAAAVESGGGSTVENLARAGRPTLLEFLKRAGPDVTPDAVTGVLGFGQRKLEQAGMTGLANPMRGQARNFVLEAGDLLRALQGTARENAAEPVTQSTLIDLLTRAGAMGATPNMGGVR